MDDPIPLMWIDAPISGHSISTHYTPSTGDAGACFSGNFIVAGDAAYYCSYGWLYYLKGTVKEAAP